MNNTTIKKNRYIKGLRSPFFFIAMLLCTNAVLKAQNFQKLISKKQQAYIDSLKSLNYPYLLPVLGEKTYNAGFDIPYPAGVMVNYFTQSQNIVISDLNVGFEGPDNSIDPIPLDTIVTFEKATASTWALTFRPDVWILPFWNVYGIFAYGKNDTYIKLAKPVQIETNTDFDAMAAGFGTNIAGGLGPGWFALDYNTSWSFIEALDKPVNVSNFSVRFGSTIVNKEKPYKNLAIWVGAFRQRIEQNTSGRVSFRQIFPGADQNLADRLEDWYAGWEEENCDRPGSGIICEPLGELVEAIADNLRTDEPIQNTDITYSLKKEVKQEWNMIIGAQYQFNKRFQFRTEGGIIGDRKSLLLSFNYRFLI
ncbi:MAG: hypothetical protein MI975_10190 [Cytophagales bacterium]|nr:hypothetical protein [Cytophagales bacterium]